VSAAAAKHSALSLLYYRVLGRQRPPAREWPSNSQTAPPEENESSRMWRGEKRKADLRREKFQTLFRQ
jgi:hypothetical protein